MGNCNGLCMTTQPSGQQAVGDYNEGSSQQFKEQQKTDMGINNYYPGCNNDFSNHQMYGQPINSKQMMPNDYSYA